MSTIRLTTAQALVRFLIHQHSERDGEVRRLIPGMFGIFGHGNVAGLGQALAEYGGDELPYLQTRNEQSMVHAACGFAKASRRLSTLVCTSSIGPGATNMVTGAALASINRLPVLLLPGDIYATRRQGPVLQQLEHPTAGDVSVNDCFRPVARCFDRITRPEQLLTALPEAMRVLTSPDATGAAVIALPQDIQSEAYDFPESFFHSRVWPVRRPSPDADEIERIAVLLAEAQRPLIIAGGGVIYSCAERELEAVAEGAGIPVAETFGGKGAVTVPAWWGVGGLGLEGNPACNETAAEADVVLAVGTRLTDFATGSQSVFRHPRVRFAAINVCDRDARKQGASFAVADARLALAELAEALRAHGVRPSEQYRAEIVERRERWSELRSSALESVGGEGMTQGNVIGAMQESARPGDTIIAAAGGPPGDLLKTWDATEGRRCHLEFGYSCMGYELPAALGVRLAQPEGEVTAFIGDGTFLMNPTELVTAVQEGLKVTVVVSENRGFQSIRRLQMLRVGREFGNEFRARAAANGPPATTIPVGGRLAGEYLALDLAKVAEGLGATGIRATTTEQVRAALESARGEAGPVVIVAQTAPHADLPPGQVWWDVAPAEVSGDELVTKLRAEYEADRERLQRYFG
jgi:3D-(3,5/4)-trihydroxycyclohexane-1,2-dione acylhydrolase (decyclizing)